MATADPDKHPEDADSQEVRTKMEVHTPKIVPRYPNDDEGSTDTSLPTKYRKKIEANFDTLLNNLDLNVILPKLREKEVITIEHYDDLWHMEHSGRRREAKNRFLQILPTRGRNAYFWFCHILVIKAGQKYLYDLLVDAEAVTMIQELLQTEQDSMVHQAAATDTDETEVMMVLSRTQSYSELDETGSLEADSKVEEMCERTDPRWVGLREYQKELAEPGIQGKTCIICAPTGSGKTMVAAYVVYHHLKTTQDRGRVVFFAPTVALVKQQHEEFKKWFSALKVDYLVGAEIQDREPVENMIKFNQITVMTPAIFSLGLRNGRIKVDDVTMMIFDECHHTHGGNIYNEIMGRYVDNKVKLQTGDISAPARLPQVIGMTASLGVGLGDAKTVESAMGFVLKICANLDARQIAVVRKCREELSMFVRELVEETIVVPGRILDPFSKLIVDAMKRIEQKIREILGAENETHPGLKFPRKKDTTEYLTYLHNLIRTAKGQQENSDWCTAMYTCLEYLTCYHQALSLYDEMRAKDALNVLQRMHEIRSKTIPENDRTEQWLMEMFSEMWTDLSENTQYDNPMLVQLKKMILEAFHVEPDTYAILFTRTRISTEALMNWVNEDPDMAHIGALRLAGTSSMTSQTQLDVTQLFKQGKGRLLIATFVAEEGLDIKCKWVFRYNYATNKIGRARMRNRRYMTITSEDQEHLKERESGNLVREGLMRTAVEKIAEMDTKRYEDEVWKYQVTDSKDRRFRDFQRAEKLAGKSRDVFIVCCFRCKEIVCLSTDIVFFSYNHYTCIKQDFVDCIEVKRSQRRMQRMRQLYTVYCKRCHLDWGCIITYEGKVQMPILKSSGFTYNTRLEVGNMVCRPAVKRWDDVPCLFKKISAEEIYKQFRGINYCPPSLLTAYLPNWNNL